MPNKSKRKTKYGDATTGRQFDMLNEEGWDAILPVPKFSFPVAAILVASSAALCFYQSCWAVFTLDDREALIHNRDLRPETPVTSLLTHDFWGYNISINGSHKSYRPLTVLTLRWNFILAGGLHPFEFHLINVVLHSVVCVVVLKVVSVVYAGIFNENGGQSLSSPRASLLTAMLFAVHPVHTESVAANVGRADLLCALFFFLSMWIYVRAFPSGDDDVSVSGFPDSKSPASFSSGRVVAAIVLAVLSMLSKEQGITVLGVLGADDYVIICRRKPSEALKLFSNDYRSKNSRWLKPFLLRVIMLASSVLLLIVYRYVIMSTGAPKFPKDINPTAHAPLLSRILTFPYLYTLNCWILINPWWLCHDWGEGCVGLLSTPSDLRVLAVVVFFAFIVSFSFYALRHGDENKVVFTAMLLLVIPFLPASNIFFHVGFVIAERALYIPLLGYAILLTLAIVKLCEKCSVHSRKVIRAILLALVVCYTIRSIRRTGDWLDDHRLHRSAIRVCPLNSKVPFNIAKDLDDLGNKTEAEKWYRESLRVNANNRGALMNLANIKMADGETEEARMLLEKCRMIEPTRPNVWLSLGNLYKDNYKDYQVAMHHYKEAERLAKIYFYADERLSLAGIYNNQAVVKREIGELDEAITLWYMVVEMQKDYDVAYFALMETLEMVGKHDEVLEVGKAALQYVPAQKTRSIQALMGKMYAMKNNLEEAEKYFTSVVGMDKRTEAEDYFNLGILYNLQGKTKDAIIAMEKSIEIDANNPKSADTLKILKQQLENGTKHS